MEKSNKEGREKKSTSLNDYVVTETAQIENQEVVKNNLRKVGLRNVNGCSLYKGLSGVPDLHGMLQFHYSKLVLFKKKNPLNCLCKVLTFHVFQSEKISKLFFCVFFSYFVEKSRS